MESRPWSDLGLTSPWMNAAGFGGFTPSASLKFTAEPGAFVTNPISLAPRKPSQVRTILPFAGGFLIHTGYPNPGFTSAVKNYAPRWEKYTHPVWVHLLPQSPTDLPPMVEVLESIENIAAIELGLPPECNANIVTEFVDAAMGELPLMVCVSIEETESPWVDQLGKAGAAGIVLTGPRGVLPNGKRNIRGRLYGPCVFPLMLKAVCRLAQQDLPLVASGGVFTKTAADTLLQAGAAAVQLDGVLWRGWED